MSDANVAARTRWRNWSGSQSCMPVEVVPVSSVADVQGAVVRAAERGLSVRAIGSGHSFSGAAVAPGVQLRLDGLSRLLDVDVETGLVTVEAGMRLDRLNVLLAEYGRALANLGDVDRQTISGAISTGTHGTGADLPGVAAQVEALEVVVADGEAHRFSHGRDPDLFDAVRVSLGAFGVITKVMLRTVPAFLLKAAEAPSALGEVLDGLDARAEEHDHFEFYWFPHTDRTLIKANDRVPADTAAKPMPRLRHWWEDEFLSNTVFEGTNRLSARWPKVVPAVNAIAARALGSRRYIDASHEVFVSPRRVRFNECEYAVPRAAVPEVLTALRRWVDAHDERIPFPVEVRFAAADSIWLSTAHERDTGYIAVHQYHRMPYDSYFGAFEEIVAAFGGRPHWGKLHTLGRERLHSLYPRFDDFVSFRNRIDPGRVFFNPYLDTVFGS